MKKLNACINELNSYTRIFNIIFGLLFFVIYVIFFFNLINYKVTIFVVWTFLLQIMILIPVTIPVHWKIKNKRERIKSKIQNKFKRLSKARLRDMINYLEKITVKKPVLYKGWAGTILSGLIALGSNESFQEVILLMFILIAYILHYLVYIIFYQSKEESIELIKAELYNLLIS